MAEKHPKWKLAKKLLTWLFFIAVIVLLVVYARKVNWEDVYNVIVNYNRLAVLSAVALVIVSYLTYGCYDLIGRAYCGHKLAKRQVMLVSFICYAFNLTLSTWVGGVAMRYRLYSRLGLDSATITRIFSLSIATNWLGYILLAGVVFSAGMVPIPGGWFIGETTLWRSFSGPAPFQSAASGPSGVRRCSCRRCAWRCFSSRSPPPTGW